MFGTDLPSTRAPRAFEVADIQLLIEAPSETGAEMALGAKHKYFMVLVLDTPLRRPQEHHSFPPCKKYSITQITRHSLWNL